MGQLIEWPEVDMEGESLEDCRAMLQDALREMIAAYQQQKNEIPIKRNKTFDRIEANQLCKQADLNPKF